MASQTNVTEQLDRIEASLPSIPSRAVALGRAATRRSTSIATAAADELSNRTCAIGSAIATAAKTTVGQARSAAERSAKAVRSAVAETTGQAEAQSKRSIDAIESETEGLLDSATHAVDPAPHNPAALDDLTKDELYSRAQERDIEGRATMNKAQLVAALRT